jgi:hemerythrin-like domain-containing protein
MPGKDAIQVLEEDHVKVEKAFERFEKLEDDDADEKQQIVSTVCSDLKVHTVIEEEILYPRLREALSDDDEIADLMDEAEVEHTSAKEMIQQLEGMSPGDDLYDAKFTVLCEYVKHHVKEERNEIFPKAKKSDLDLDAMGEELEARKRELAAQLEEEDSDAATSRASTGRRAGGANRASTSKRKSTTGKGAAVGSRSSQRTKR